MAPRRIAALKPGLSIIARRTPDLRQESSMPRPAVTQASQQALQDAAAPTPPKLSMGDIGQAGTRDALADLTAAMRELKAMAAAPLLKRAIEALNREDFDGGGKWALKALDKDERNGVG